MFRFCFSPVAFLSGLVFCVLVSCALVSCSKPPECHYRGLSTEAANAGCLVVSENKLLIVEDNQGRFSLPGGSKNFGEVAQCTAEREVWEESGVKVMAGELVATFDNGFQLFRCEVVAGQVLDGSQRPLRHEIEAVHWLGVDDFAGKNWRFPQQVPLMKSEIEITR